MNETYLALYEKLSRLQWLLQRNHMQNHAAHGPMADPTRGQGRVLAVLRLQPEITTKDLGYLLGIRQQSLNELLNKLEKGGYVTRAPSEADRRVMLVTLTEKGREEPQAAEPDFAGIFGCLSAEEQEVFGEYLDRVIAALKEQVTAEDREDVERWMQAARSRMGEEQFERFVAMRGGPHGPCGPFGPHGHGPFGRGHGSEGHCGHKHGRHPHPPAHPEGPFGQGHKHHHPHPPAPPEGFAPEHPKEPEDE